MAAALGVKFHDRDGKAFVPAGGTLQNVTSIDTSGLDPRLAKTEIVTMCDIDNPLYGPTGAAYIFAPQKGADEATVRLLDAGLKHFADVIQNDLKIDVSKMPGSGAAGGMGAGMVAFLHSKLQMGIETVLDTVHFDQLLKDTDMVFTGEGKIDTQSLRGKVVIGVAKRAKRAGVPVIAVVGDVGDQIDDAYSMGVTSIFSINRVAVEFREARKRSSKDLRSTMDDVMRLMGRIGF
jgi:glycerate kinase